MTQPETDDLCGCLRRIAAHLEKGDAVEASLVVGELHEILSGPPAEMRETELIEARSLLAHCEALERELRKDVLGSLQLLAATRKSAIYRGYGSAP